MFEAPTLWWSKKRFQIIGIRFSVSDFDCGNFSKVSEFDTETPER
jgi:hypothetical protein